MIREYLSEVEAKTDPMSAGLLILDCLMGKLQISQHDQIPRGTYTRGDLPTIIAAQAS